MTDPCPHIRTSNEGTSYCALAERRIRELEAERERLRETTINEVIQLLTKAAPEHWTPEECAAGIRRALLEGE